MMCSVNKAAQSITGFCGLHDQVCVRTGQMSALLRRGSCGRKHRTWGPHANGGVLIRGYLITKIAIPSSKAMPRKT